MKTYTITKENFLKYFFQSGSDQEQEANQIDLGQRVIERLLSGEDFFYSVEDAFNECEISCIPLAYLEEFDDDNELEVGELEEVVDVILID
jgi:hypothetical protein